MSGREGYLNEAVPRLVFEFAGCKHNLTDPPIFLITFEKGDDRNIYHQISNIN